MFPSSDVPGTAQGFADVFGPGTATMAAYARDLTVRGSESTLKLLLGNGVTIDYETILADFPKKPDGKPLSLKGVTDTAMRLSELSIHTMERRSNEIATRSQSRRARSESMSHV